MTARDATQIATLLTEYGQRSGLRGDNRYRSKAYLRAAENIGALTEPLAEIIAEGRLREIPGVGDAIADIITKLYETGTHPSLEKMRADVPAGVRELLAVPGLRPDKVLKLHKELGISSMDELEGAARAGRLASIKGLGASLQSKILRGIEIHKSARGQLHLHRAAELLAAFENNLKRSHPDVVSVTSAGDFRRACELVSDLSVVATVKRRRKPEILRLGNGAKVHLTDELHYGATLLHATGSAKHIQALNEIAAAKRLKLRADGLWKGAKRIAGETEEAIYKSLGLAWIPPELREGLNEIELAKVNRLPRLLEDEDIRGILHAHTDRSDGVHTLEQMADATRDRGYAYFGVADHSKSAHYAGGLSIDEIEEQHREANRLNGRYGKQFHIFKGIESDILVDGSLDYDDHVLSRFDFVIASVHSRFALDRHSQTERILRAVWNPRTTILGHMTGRQLLRRPGYELDIEKVLKACADCGVAVEINANPWRLDIDWRWHQTALSLGCMLSVNPDAHSTKELDLTRWGVAMARKGGVPRERVLNCLTLARFQEYLDARRSVVRKRGTATARARARAVA
ncbi:MAG: polymerase [Variibacter sp.]|nr:polymerase [Variibacter sp.]